MLVSARGVELARRDAEVLEVLMELTRRIVHKAGSSQRRDKDPIARRSRWLLGRRGPRRYRTRAQRKGNHNYTPASNHFPLLSRTEGSSINRAMTPFKRERRGQVTRLVPSFGIAQLSPPASSSRSSILK